MEEWFRKLKLLHWTCIERPDRTSPFVCFDDGGDGGDGGDGDDDDDDDDDDDPENDYASFDNAMNAMASATTMEMSAKEGGSTSTGSSFGAGGSEAATGIEAGNTAFEGWEAGTTGGPGMEGQSLESGTGAGAGYGSGADTGGGATAGGAGTGGGSTETAGLEGGAGAGIGGGGTQDSQGGGGSGGGALDLFDLPPIGRPRNKEELDREFEREFQQQFTPPTPSPLPPPPQFNAPTPVSNRVSQAPIAPGVLPSGAVANPFGNPPTDPTKEQNQLPNQGRGYPGVDFTIPDPNAPQAPAPPAVAGRTGREERGKEDDLRDSPFGPQAALNTFGFNFTSPPGYNTAFSGMPTTPGAPQGAPQGAPPPDQQVAQGPPAPPLGTSVQTTPYAQTLADLVTTGPPGRDTSRGDREVREGRTDPFGRDAQNPNIFDPNTFTPSVGMLMSGINSMPAAPNPNSAFQTGAAPFGPQAPTQASPQVAQGRDPTIFDPTAISSQVPSALQGLQATQQQTPPSVATRTGREGLPSAPPPPEQFSREQLAILTDPRALQPYAPPPNQYGPPAPPPSRTVDIPSHNQYEWPAQAPGRNFTVDPSGNLSFEREQPPTGQQPGPSAITGAMPAGGVPLGDLPGGFPSSQPSQGGGGSGVVQLPPRQQQQLSAQRKRLPQTAQERRDAITEALMRRDLNAPGVSDFDRLRLQP